MTKQEFEKGIKRVLIPQTEIQEKIQAVGAQWNHLFRYRQDHNGFGAGHQQLPRYHCRGYH